MSWSLDDFPVKHDGIYMIFSPYPILSTAFHSQQKEWRQKQKLAAILWVFISSVTVGQYSFNKSKTDGAFSFRWLSRPNIDYKSEAARSEPIILEEWPINRHYFPAARSCWMICYRYFGKHIIRWQCTVPHPPRSPSLQLWAHKMFLRAFSEKSAEELVEVLCWLGADEMRNPPGVISSSCRERKLCLVLATKKTRGHLKRHEQPSLLPQWTPFLNSACPTLTCGAGAAAAFS
jgi:hypothetical protein